MFHNCSVIPTAPPAPFDGQGGPYYGYNAETGFIPQLIPPYNSALALGYAEHKAAYKPEALAYPSAVPEMLITGSVSRGKAHDPRRGDIRYERRIVEKNPSSNTAFYSIAAVVAAALAYTLLL